jgi:hypothetical protein
VFERVSDAPGLESLDGPPEDTHDDDSARRAMEMVFGALATVGDVFRAVR